MSDVDEFLARVQKLTETEHANNVKTMADLQDQTDRLIAGQAAQVAINGLSKLLTDPTPPAEVSA